MPDFLQLLRQRSIFNPAFGNDLPSQGGITGTMYPDQFNDWLSGMSPPTNPWDVDFGQTLPLDMSVPQVSPEYDAAARMRELYNPTTEATRQFEGMLGAYPQREDPSLLRRLGASIIDVMKGPEEGRRFFEEPFTHKLMDWKNRIVPAQQAANLERQENINARQFAYQQISAELRDKAQQARERNDERNAQIRQQRADVYEFKAKNPAMRIVIPKGGNVQAVNPVTGEVHDTGIPTGSLTELDKLNLQQEGRLGQIAATGEEARRTEGVRQVGREAVAETRGWQIYNVPDPANPGQQKAVQINQITGEVRDIAQAKAPIGGVARPTGAAGARPELPTQTRVRQYNAARELMNSSPALARFIRLIGTNDFEIKKPQTNLFGKRIGPTVEQYNIILKHIYGGTTPSPVPSHTPGITTKPLATPPAAPAGWKYIPKQGGGWTAVPATSREEF